MGGRLHAQRRMHQSVDYGVNPRFMLAMARVAMAKSHHELPERRRQGLTRFRDPNRDVTILSRLQLDARCWSGSARKQRSAYPRRGAGFRVLCPLQCAQDAAYRAAGARYNGCARRHLSGYGWADPLLRHPSVNYGDVEMSGRMGSNSIENVALDVRQVISWCPIATSSSPKPQFQPSNGNADPSRSR